jgi:hypothetical protein
MNWGYDNFNIENVTAETMPPAVLPTSLEVREGLTYFEPDASVYLPPEPINIKPIPTF